MVGADDRVVVATPHVIHPRFELNEIVNVRSIFNRPVHAAANTTEREAPLSITARDLLECCQHPILIETAFPKIDFGVDANLELSALPGSCRVDSDCGQSSQMDMTLIRIHDVDRLVAALEPVLNERQQHAIFLIVAIEKRADMTYFAELGAGKGNRCSRLLHGVSSHMACP